MAENTMLCLSWSSDIEEILIEEIRKRDYLWNIKDPMYIKRSYKRLGYIEIQGILKEQFPFRVSLFSTPEMINKKFSNLKQYYRSEKKKIATLKSGSAGGISIQSKWIHFQRMTFLDDVMEAEESRSNLDESRSFISSQPLMELDTNVQEEEIPALENNDELEMTWSSQTPTRSGLETTPTPGPSQAKNKRKRNELAISNKRHASSDVLEKATEILNKIDSKEDGEDGFGKFIADYMRKLDHKLREKARINMLKALYDTVFDER